MCLNYVHQVCNPRMISHNDVEDHAQSAQVRMAASPPSLEASFSAMQTLGLGFLDFFCAVAECSLDSLGSQSPSPHKHVHFLG